jgi:hypothetical protein
MSSIRNIALAIGLALLVYMVIAFNARIAELNRLSAERDVINTRLVSRQQTNSSLEIQSTFAASDAATLKWGYEHHMARPGDVRVIPIGIGQVTPSPTPKPTVIPTQVSNLERWYTLFLGQLSP